MIGFYDVVHIDMSFNTEYVWIIERSRDWKSWESADTYVTTEWVSMQHMLLLWYRCVIACLTKCENFTQRPSSHALNLLWYVTQAFVKDIFLWDVWTSKLGWFYSEITVLVKFFKVIVWFPSKELPLKITRLRWKKNLL